MRIPAAEVVAGTIALLTTVGLTSDLPPETAPAPEPVPTEVVTEYVEVPADPYVIVTRPTHPCHEDEAGIVQPHGYYCVPVDDLQPDRAAADRAIAESGRAAYWPSEYDIQPRNAHDTDPGR